MKKAKLIILLSIFIFIIGVILILMWTVFALSSVSVDFRYAVDDSETLQTEIINSAEFDYGQSVFFASKSKYIAKIESTFADIKVINIETIFPNSFVIHVAKRVAYYSLQVGDEFYSLDNDFKVLSKSSENDESLIALDISLYENSTINVCDFLSLDNDYYVLYSTLLASNVTLSMQLATFSKVKIENENINLFLRSGQQFYIENMTYYLRQKLERAYLVQSELYDDLIEEDGVYGKYITTTIDSSGNGVDEFFSIDDLNTCKISILDHPDKNKKIYATVSKS